MAVLGTVSLGAGCGESAGADAAPSVDAASCALEPGRLFPLATGISWTFDVTDTTSGEVEVKIQTVGPLEELSGDRAGISAFRLTSDKSNGTVVSWQEDTGTEIRRHREIDRAGGTQGEEFYDPYKLRVADGDDRRIAGASWTEQYQETWTDAETSETTTIEKTEEWFIEAAGELVKVPAGEFCAVRVRRVNTTETPSSEKTFWFAPGVGKVKEDDGGERLEELVTYEMP